MSDSNAIELPPAINVVAARFLEERLAVGQCIRCLVSAVFFFSRRSCLISSTVLKRASSATHDSVSEPPSTLFHLFFLLRLAGFLPLLAFLLRFPVVFVVFLLPLGRPTGRLPLVVVVVLPLLRFEFAVADLPPLMVVVVVVVVVKS